LRQAGLRQKLAQVKVERRDIAIGPVTIHLPDASIADFWFMRDLAELLGVETNAEAESLLEAALGSARRGVDLDREADFVFVHAEGPAAMVRVLEALNSIAVNRPLWAPDEIRHATELMRAWRRPTPVPYDVGSVVRVPLRDGTFGAAHVVAFAYGGSVRGLPLVVLLDVRSATGEDLAVATARGDGTGVGGAVILDSEIVSGEWPVVGTRSSGGDHGALLAREEGQSSSASLMAGFLDAYHGLRLWDAMADPRFYELILLPGVPPPASRRYLRDVFEQRVQAACGRTPHTVATGPAVLDVHIAYPGGGLPRLIDLPKSRQLAERIARDVPGASIVVTGGGCGFLDVFASTTDAAAGIRAVEIAARDLGIDRVTMVEAFPALSLEGLRES
jgi:hypothetical protein